MCKNGNIENNGKLVAFQSMIYRNNCVHCLKRIWLYSDSFSSLALVTRLLSQGNKVNRLSNTFKKFYGRHTDLVGQYNKNVC